MSAQEILNRVKYITESDQEVSEAWNILHFAYDVEDKQQEVNPEDAKQVIKMFCIGH